MAGSQGISVGGVGAGSLIVNGGTVASSGFSSVGAHAERTGTASVSGGGIWTNTQGLAIGQFGVGALTVNGGTFYRRVSAVLAPV